MQPMDLSAYRDLWKTHGVMALLASALLARLPVMATMVPLAFLAKDAAGNFGWAGVVAGAYSVGTAVASVVWSRLADRRGARRVVIATGMAWGVSMAVRRPAAVQLVPGDAGGGRAGRHRSSRR